ATLAGKDKCRLHYRRQAGYETPFHPARQSCLPSVVRDREIKFRSTTQLRFHPDAAVVALDNTLADRKTHARSGDRLAVKSLKRAENLRVVLRSDAEAIVGHNKVPCTVRVFSRDEDLWPLLSAIFDRIRNQILKKLHEVCSLAFNLRQTP